MKRFSVIAAILLASFVGTIAAPVFAQAPAAPAAPAEEKKPMKKPMKKAKKPMKKAMKKDEMKKDDAKK